MGNLAFESDTINRCRRFDSDVQVLQVVWTINLGREMIMLMEKWKELNLRTAYTD